MSTPAMDFNHSPDRRDWLPLPPEAKVSSPGRALASATNSRTFFAGTALCTTRMFEVMNTCEIGAKSFTGSYGSLYRLGLMTSCASFASPSV